MNCITDNALGGTLDVIRGLRGIACSMGEMIDVEIDSSKRGHYVVSKLI